MADPFPTLSFDGVCVDIQDKRILWDVTGRAEKGEILAMMGPSGSGKTTLLSALSGHVQTSGGTILVRGHKMNKTIRRRISYVLQSDLFFENLTLRETLLYSALLRLSSRFTLKEKIQRVDQVIETLNLQDCQNTIIGSPLKRGLSGGEKKRTNIACELLTDPFILLLDEPTSGLDSSAAFSLFTTLKKLAHEEGKTVITSIHQPSSQLFYSFDRLLLIAKGKVAYCGPALEVMDHFSSVGLHCTLHYNPADFIIEMVTDAGSREVLIGPDPPDAKSPAARKRWQTIWPISKLWDCVQYVQKRRSYNPPASVTNSLADQPSMVYVCDGQKGDGQLVEAGTAGNNKGISLSVILDEDVERKTTDESKHGLSPSASLSSSSLPNGLRGKRKRVSLDDVNPAMAVMEVENGAPSGRMGRRPTAITSFVEASEILPKEQNQRWLVPWYWQCLVLSHRAFKQSRPIILSKLNFLQTVALTFAVCIVWFQMRTTEETIRDHLGFLFFTILYWSFDGMARVINVFPTERVVVAKERSAGSYRLSAYYLATTFSMLPLILIQPTLFFIPVFPIIGLTGVGKFFGLWFLLLLQYSTTQSLGLFLSALTMDIQLALVLGIIMLLGLLLVGGFYIQNLPFWIVWSKYISPITYGYHAAILLTFDSGIQFLCHQTGISEYPQFCSINSTHPLNSTMYIPGQAVVQAQGVEFHLALNLGLLAIFALAFRVLAYLSLRFLRRKKVPQ